MTGDKYPKRYEGILEDKLNKSAGKEAKSGPAVKLQDPVRGEFIRSWPNNRHQ